MPALLEESALYAGTTILGDGRVALILDVLGIAQHARFGAEETGSAGALDLPDDEVSSDLTDSYIVVEAADHRLALPMESVARMEHVANVAIEHINGGMVVQYRNGILPLIDLGVQLGGPATCLVANVSVPVVVVVVGGREVGIVCDEILDVETVLTSGVNDDVLARSRPIVVGNAVIDGTVAQVLDLEAMVAAPIPVPAPSPSTAGAPS